MAEQAYWYVVHTYSGYENKVAQDLMTMVENRRLQDLICDVKVPTETVIEDKLDKSGNKIGEKEVQHKIYPGYVFVKMVMNDNTWYIVRNTRGCTGFVGPASKPEPLTEDEVAKLGVEIVSGPRVDYAGGRHGRADRRPHGRFRRRGRGDRHPGPQGPRQDLDVRPRDPCRAGPLAGQAAVTPRPGTACPAPAPLAAQTNFR